MEGNQKKEMEGYLTNPDSLTMNQETYHESLKEVHLLSEISK